MNRRGSLGDAVAPARDAAYYLLVAITALVWQRGQLSISDGKLSVQLFRCEAGAIFRGARLLPLPEDGNEWHPIPLPRR